MRETAINLCSPMSLANVASFPKDELLVGQQMLSELGLSEASRVYIGNESCDFLFNRRYNYFIETANRLRKNGWGITVVTPPVSQSMFLKICDKLLELDKDETADELVLNDIGILTWAKENIKYMRLHAGRCFDKIAREARFNVFNHEGFIDHQNIYGTPYVMQNEISAILQHYHVETVELDAVPSGKLNLQNEGWKFSFYYPEVILSYCTTCEFAGASLPASQKFIPGNCEMECMEYMITVHGKSLLKIVKRGRLVEGLDFEAVNNRLIGECRIVVDPQYWRFR
jgi:hypothetical protein